MCVTSAFCLTHSHMYTWINMFVHKHTHWRLLHFDQCGSGSLDMSGYVGQVAVQITSAEQEKTCLPLCHCSAVSRSDKTCLVLFHFWWKTYREIGRVDNIMDITTAFLKHLPSAGRLAICSKPALTWERTTSKNATGSYCWSCFSFNTPVASHGQLGWLIIWLEGES